MGSCCRIIQQKEAQLMLSNPRDAFSGQSRSPNMVAFDMLGIVSYQCAIVTLPLRSAVYLTFPLKGFPLELGTHVSGRKLERWVPDDPESFKIGLAVYIQQRHVTDRQTDRHATTAKTARIKMRKMRVRKTVNARTFIQAEIYLFQFFVVVVLNVTIPCNFGNKDSQKAHHNLTIVYIRSIYYSIHEVVEDVRFGCRILCMLMFKKIFCQARHK